MPLVECRDLEDILAPACAGLKGTSGSVAVPGGCFGVTLYTDSAHLREFFVANWGGHHRSPILQPELMIVALSGRGATSLGELEPGVRHVNVARTMIASVGNEYYGNIKISVRGLCSAAARAMRRGGFLHGASMVLDGTGLVIGGTSGAGKTTITKVLLDSLPGAVRVVNDDWGWADHEQRSLQFTGEPYLHMKYRSVRTLAPGLALTPDRYTSENYGGDASDPHARLLIPRDVVFAGATVDAAIFGAYVVLQRDTSRPFFARTLGPDDVGLLEVAEYSAFYERHERFLDGSLLLISDADVDAERQRFRELLSRVPSLLVNNVGTPAEAARAVVAHVEGLSS